MGPPSRVCMFETSDQIRSDQIRSDQRDSFPPGDGTRSVRYGTDQCGAVLYVQYEGGCWLLLLLLLLLLLGTYCPISPSHPLLSCPIPIPCSASISMARGLPERKIRDGLVQ